MPPTRRPWHHQRAARMEVQEQNLATVATDLGIDPQTLIDALVECWSPTPTYSGIDA